MKQSLQLRLGQNLAMTPQLQQAIKLLQLSTLDLQQEIQQALDSNMMLEVSDEESGFTEPSEPAETVRQENDYGELGNLDTPADIPQELGVDSSWEDVYDNVQSYTPPQNDSDNDDYLFQRAPAETLHDHLAWQMELTPFSEQDYAIATAIIDGINDDGYLTSSIEEVHQGLLSQIEDLDLDEVVAVLHRVQNFDPPGIAAQNLAECLSIQLRQLPDDTPWQRQALNLTENHLDVLARRDLNKLKRALEIGDEELNHVIALIRTLEPKPGRTIAIQEAQYVIPDVFVFRVAQEWVVTLNPDIAPKLRVNPFYSGMIKRADNSADNVTMKNHLQEARWFIKSLQSRNETLLKVARSIVEHQKDFLEYGERAMKPLVLRDVAEEVEMHESTISRVTTQKYMHTPNGVYEFKYFFSSHVSTDAGGECSATAIKAYLKEMIEQEDQAKPLSDHALSAMLKDKGIQVARRTVAKYREALNIPPSNERKRVF
ncbi:RNA polymerase factor sigma-54 [Methylococcus sp. EFPC2]|uniref:RNA polymerase factor sigma-54 n=1 Tax=Methylococcus sp. EFPC2 TaxID=2812648 RepID=UPI001967A200|nr:RNA polymerase factor sigma-54 [Methylococcus sp. EFPC2]QSA97953.1 RNA polymerase factor sigma-54 [Methylococcus sp. EFPC2]